MSYEELESALIKEKDLHSLTRNRFQEADKYIDKLRAELKERDILLDKMNEEMISLRKELQEYENMVEWIEENSNNGLCDYYNRIER